MWLLVLQMFSCWRRLGPWERFKWGQKGASVVHSAIMASVGASVMLRGDWGGSNMIHSTDERVAAFIGLEIGYLLQVHLYQTPVECWYLVEALGSEIQRCYLLYHSSMHTSQATRHGRMVSPCWQRSYQREVITSSDSLDIGVLGGKLSP
jgi:hypothetical protein